MSDNLKNHFFLPFGQESTVRRGEVLLRQGQQSNRLYLVLEGQLAGFFAEEGEEKVEIFRSGPGNLIGGYSFFSGLHRSYSTVIAETDARLVYLDGDAVQRPGFDYPAFAVELLPVVVNEIYIRQVVAHRLSRERQAAMERLLQAERLASLGQLAAGLAHELNNAIGVVQRNGDLLVERLRAYIREKDGVLLFDLLESGIEHGQVLSSTEVRRRRRELEERFHLDTPLARELARTGLSDEQIRQLPRPLDAFIDKLQNYYSTGVALHDLVLAAKHAGHVVASVRELGSTHQRELHPISITQTLREALVLLHNRTKQVRVQTEFAPDLPPLLAAPSDWIQVWVNLIRNAHEALVQAHTERPCIQVRSRRTETGIEVEIEDNGPGIPPEVVERIFQPNFTTKRDGLSFGLGLGLSIVERIVTSYQGTISVDSRPGRTVFLVQLPVGGHLAGLT